MVKNPLVKDIFREIKGTFSRFISIFTIVALGVIFLSGLKTTAPDMERTADGYFDAQGLMDIHILSTLGITQEDVAAHRALDYIEAAEGAYSADGLVSGGDNEFAVRVHSLMASGMNSPRVLEGRMPEHTGECVAEQRMMTLLGLSLGDGITVDTGDKDDSILKVAHFTVVGIVEAPYYISYTRGTAAVGDGTLDSFIYVPVACFDSEVYTELYLRVRGAKDLLCYSKAYEDLISAVEDRLEPVGEARTAQRHDQIVSEAEAKLNDAVDALSAQEAEARTQLADVQNQLVRSRAELDQGKTDLAGREAMLESQLSDGQAALKASEAQIGQGETELNDGYNQLYAGIDDLNAAQRSAELEFADAESKLRDGQTEYQNNLAQLQETEARLETMKQMIEAIEQAGGDAESMAPMKAEYEAGRAGVAAGKTQLEAARQQLDAQKAALETQKAEAYTEIAAKRQAADDALAVLHTKERQLDQAKQDLAAARQTLSENEKQGRQAIAEARAQLDEGEAQYESGLADYEKANSEMEAKFADAWLEIDDKRAEIAKIDAGQWYILGRDTNPGYVGYGQDADRMKALSSVFPVIFFIVAALVCLTNMTRMVDEHRTQIGAVKAMGYGDLAASAKYVLYALFASLGGSVAGLLIGCNLIPRVIFAAYDMLYDLPALTVPFYPGYSLYATLAAMACTVGATVWAIYSATRELPATLMRPRAPRPGKRVLLERVGFIWRNLGFIRKVSIRNLLRYKKRFFMTVIGIAGCTALIITGFGLKDSIYAITDRQFGEVFTFDLQADLDSDAPQARQDEVKSFIQNSDRVTASFFGRLMTVSVESDARSESAFQVVPFDNAGFAEMFNLRDMETGGPIALTDEGIVIGKKLSELLDVKVGDTVTIVDTQRATATVAAINEQYAFHYIYMTPAYYEKLFGAQPETNAAYMRLTDGSEASISDFSEQLMDYSAVKACSNKKSTADKFKETMDVINLAVSVIIVSAALLAFVVLYNLNNINVTERIRELATIKVLGFFDTEVSWYMYRENIVLTLIGMALGTVFGKYLTKWMIRTVEVDFVMFGREAEPDSYLKAVLLTLLFAFVVNFVLHFRLRKIPMVESLKAVE